MEDDRDTDTRTGPTTDQPWASVRDAKILVGAPKPIDEQRADALRSAGCELSRTRAWEVTLDRLASEHFEAVFLDAALPPSEPAQTPLSGAAGSPTTLLWVDRPTPASFRRVLELGMDTFAGRNDDAASMLRLLEQERRIHSSEDVSNGELVSADPMVGTSDAMCQICRQVGTAAASTAPVHISGETGVGKELVARAIHRLSPRRRQPFVAVNCGAIPEHLVESELFGHVKGAFTGATSARKGKFEQADNGTLLLDEIGELSRSMQVKLLRVLEHQTFQRVGGTETLSVDVRVLSATNRDLAADLEDDHFRRDLFFRLNVLEIDVPPLREHRDDIEPLWAHFVGLAASREACRPPETDEEVRGELYRHPWPGNVRQLRNVARHVVTVSPARRVSVEHLPDRFDSHSDAPNRADPEFLRVPGMSLEQVERATILRTHEWADDVQQTADILDISERKIYYKLKEYRQQGMLEADSPVNEDDPNQPAPSPTDAPDEELPSLIIAEDDRQLQWSLQQSLGRFYTVQTATTGHQLVEQVRTEPPDVILSDIRMPGLDGIQVLRELQTDGWDVPVVLITAYGDDQNCEQADCLGASAVIDKPVEPPVLHAKLQEALDADGDRG